MKDLCERLEKEFKALSQRLETAEKMIVNHQERIEELEKK